MSLPRKKVLGAEEVLARIQDLEGSFYDAANAAGVVWDLLSNMFEGSIAGEETVGGVEHCHIIDPGQLERLHYAASDSWRKAEKLKHDLLAGLGYGA